MPFWSELSLQDAMSLTMSLSHQFHDYLMMILILIVAVVAMAIVDIVSATSNTTAFVDYPALESWWTVVPGLVLVVIAAPSLHLLYVMDEPLPYSTGVNVIGHQWFWEYAYPACSGSFESYIQPLNSLSPRLLSSDSRLVLPANTSLRVLVSSVDVIHSWALPSLGLKVDAIPGRLNQLGYSSLGAGLIYGQCSEICGANHSFMPIVVESLAPKAWVEWATTP